MHMMAEPFMLRALAAGCLLAVIGGFLGCIIVWRRLACFTDSLSHGVLPGVALGFLFEASLIWSAFFSAVLMALFIEKMRNRMAVSTDTMLIAVAQIMFAVGIIIMYVSPGLNASLMTLLLGDILSVSSADLALIGFAAAGIICFLVCSWRRITLMCISEEIALAEGINVSLYNFMIMALTAVFTAISLQTVGIILAGSVLVIPAASSRSFARSATAMPFLACIIGIVGTAAGIIFSYFFDIPTAPAIVVSLGIIFIGCCAAGSLKRLFVLLFLIAGCTQITPPEAFVYTEIKTDAFSLASWQKVTRAGAPYKIFIEGDGYAFDRWGQPTANPTPKGTLMRELAFNRPLRKTVLGDEMEGATERSTGVYSDVHEDTSTGVTEQFAHKTEFPKRSNDAFDNVIYLARPCQFVKDDACREFYWTHGRFSREVVDSTAQAIKSIVGDGEAVLTGYSGGAQVAGLVAVLYPDIKIRKLITIAGNLDHPAWVKYHGLQPLTGSLSLTDFRDAYLKIPQIHYVGEKDTVVPPSITRDFIRDAAPVVTLPDATHDKGWLLNLIIY